MVVIKLSFQLGAERRRRLARMVKVLPLWAQRAALMGEEARLTFPFPCLCPLELEEPVDPCQTVVSEDRIPLELLPLDVESKHPIDPLLTELPRTQ